MNGITPLAGWPFLQWCADPMGPLQLEVRLNVSALQPNMPLSQQSFVEPTFPGYRAAGNEIWFVRTLQSTGSGLAQSGVLNWVASDNNTSNVVRGYFVRLLGNGNPMVVAAEDLTTQAPMAAKGNFLGLVVMVQGMVLQVTG